MREGTRPRLHPPTSPIDGTYMADPEWRHTTFCPSCRYPSAPQIRQASNAVPYPFGFLMIMKRKDCPLTLIVNRCRFASWTSFNGTRTSLPTAAIDREAGGAEFARV